MRSLVTRILWIALAAALVYGGFIAYERWWSGDLTPVKDRVLSFVNDKAGTVKDRAVEAGGSALEEVKQQATETAKSAITSAIGGVIQSFGETIQHYGESVAATPAVAPAPPVSSPSFSVPPPPVALSVNVKEELVFAVSEGTRYNAAWGDGTSDGGEKASDITMFLRHSWKAPGDYTVTLITEDDETTHTENFPVRVYE